MSADDTRAPTLFDEMIAREHAEQRARIEGAIDGTGEPVAECAAWTARELSRYLPESIRPAVQLRLADMTQRAKNDSEARESLRSAYNHTAGDLHRAVLALMRTGKPEAMDEARDIAADHGIDLSEYDPADCFGERSDVEADDDRERAADMRREYVRLGDAAE